MQTSPESYLPCPICHGTEGCDHTYPERAAAFHADNTKSWITGNSPAVRKALATFWDALHRRNQSEKSH